MFCVKAEKPCRGVEKKQAGVCVIIEGRKPPALICSIQLEGRGCMLQTWQRSSSGD